jgi:hypothetical protein
MFIAEYGRGCCRVYSGSQEFTRSEMSVNINIGEGKNRGPSIGCALLALLATAISLTLSILTGWQFGDLLQEKLAMAALGVLAVLGVHLMLVFCRLASTGVRLVAIVLWLFCAFYVAYSHATFFLSVQQEAGMRRVAAAGGLSLNSGSKRNLTAIMSDLAKIKTELAFKSRARCVDDCFARKVKAISLRAQLDALNAEAGDVTRWQEKQDRLELLQDEVRDDPVAARLAIWLGVTASLTGLVTGFIVSIILEGLGCVCWYVALQRRDLPATRSVMQPVTTVTEEAINGNADFTQPLSPLDGKVEELIREVKAGRLKLRVFDVREYYGCAQETASELRRLVDAELNSKKGRAC